MKKRILSLLLAGTLAVSLAVPALAAEDSAVKTYPVINQARPNTSRCAPSPRTWASK